MNLASESRPPALPGLWKIALFVALLFLGLAGLLARLTQVQVVEGTHYAAAARANQVRHIPVAAPRGRIYDRNGVLLVRSRPSYVCAMIPSDVKDPEATLRALAQVLDIPEAALWKRLLHHRGVDYRNFDELASAEPYGPVILASELSSAQMARLAESQDELPGIDLEAQPVRDYPYRRMGSHAFGYVGLITEEEYKQRKGNGYTPNDVVGKDGLEASYDAVLRGKPGGERIEVNSARSNGAPARPRRTRARRQPCLDAGLAHATARRNGAFGRARRGR